VTLTNGLGGSGDWLAFAPTTAANSVYTQFTYVGAGVTTRTWTVTAPSTAGTYEFRLFPNNGFTRAATSPPVTVTAPSPTLTVSATTVAPGASVTVTLSNGPGGAWDWLALAATTAPNTSYVTYTFVGGGVTSRTWTVTMPSTPGTYEFRLFLNNGYTRAATSPPINVQ
jgi:nitrous oxidase accessory protein